MGMPISNAVSLAVGELDTTFLDLCIYDILHDSTIRGEDAGVVGKKLTRGSVWHDLIKLVLLLEIHRYVNTTMSLFRIGDLFCLADVFFATGTGHSLHAVIIIVVVFWLTFRGNFNDDGFRMLRCVKILLAGIGLSIASLVRSDAFAIIVRIRGHGNALESRTGQGRSVHSIKSLIFILQFFYYLCREFLLIQSDHLQGFLIFCVSG